MKLMNRCYFFIACLLFLLVSPAFAQADFVNNITEAYSAVRSFGEEYFPLKTYVSRTYNSDIGKTSSELNYDKMIYTLTYKSGGIVYRQRLINRPDGIFLLATENRAYIFNNTIKYNKPLPLLPLPLKVNDKWEWEGYEIQDEDSVKINVHGRVLGEEELKIPAGTFKTVKISLVTVSAEGAKNDMVQWLAPEVGLVKMHAKIKGKGFSFFIQKLLGLSEVNFELVSADRK